MRKEQFSVQRHSKLFSRGNRPFQVIKIINDSVYKLDLSSHCSVSASFNVAGLSLLDAGDDLRTNPFQERGNDWNLAAKDS